jgi:hypothetical protein
MNLSLDAHSRRSWGSDQAKPNSGQSRGNEPFLNLRAQHPPSFMRNDS